MSEQPAGDFGSLAFERGRVLAFEEKPQGDGRWINGGFSVLDPSVLDLVEGDQCTREQRRCRLWLKLASFPLTTIRVSGSRWTPCATRFCWRPSGR